MFKEKKVRRVKENEPKLYVAILKLKEEITLIQNIILLSELNIFYYFESLQNKIEKKGEGIVKLYDEIKRKERVNPAENTEDHIRIKYYIEVGRLRKV